MGPVGEGGRLLSMYFHTDEGKLKKTAGITWKTTLRVNNNNHSRILN